LPDRLRRIGRFAPSPTGPLHAGSLVAALASWLDVRARGPQARWLVRIEDADTERCLPGMAERILAQLAACGLRPDAPPQWQTRRTDLYQDALDRLVAAQWAYPCGCSRKDIDLALAARGIPHARHGERVYPGTCRDGLHGKPARAWRFTTAKFEAAQGAGLLQWNDRRLGAQQQSVGREVGDFVLQRADGPWAYQLAVVVDDAEQGVTDVLRADDLMPSTPRQLLLYEALGLPPPRFCHVPLVVGEDGLRLAKRHGDTSLRSLREQGVAGDVLVGHLAFLCGLRPKGTKCTARELLKDFDLDKLPRKPVRGDEHGLLK
jgi:glutamyl-Q tRNA(Asp) synthetase